MYAYVSYVKDNVRQIVDVSDIKDFRPRDKCDFNPSTPVRVLWRGIRGEIAVDRADRYTAQILKMADTKYELERLILHKRIAIPKLLEWSDATSADESTQFNAEVEQDKFRVPQQGQTERARLKAIISKYQKAHETSEVHSKDEQQLQPDKTNKLAKRCHATSDEGGNSSFHASHEEPLEKRAKYKEKFRLLQKEMNKKNEEVVQLKQQIALLESTKEALQDDVKQLQELNHGLQHEVLDAVRGQAGTRSTTDKADTRRELFHTESLAIDEDVPQSPGCSGSSLLVSPSAMKYIRAQRNDSMFVKSMALAIWGSAELANRSVTGIKGNRHSGSEEKRSLTPAKVQGIKDELKRHLEANGRSADYIALVQRKVPRFLNEKIHDLRRKQKSPGPEEAEPRSGHPASRADVSHHKL